MLREWQGCLIVPRAQILKKRDFAFKFESIGFSNQRSDLQERFLCLEKRSIS